MASFAKVSNKELFPCSKQVFFITVQNPFWRMSTGTLIYRPSLLQNHWHGYLFNISDTNEPTLVHSDTCIIMLQLVVVVRILQYITTSIAIGTKLHTDSFFTMATDYKQQIRSHINKHYNVNIILKSTLNLDFSWSL